MIIRAANNLDANALNSYLSTAGTVGQTTFPVDNINSFYPSWAVQFGKTGEEYSEIKVLSAATPSGTAVTTTAGATYPHPKETPLFAIKYDKIIFLRSTTGTAGTASAFTGSTVSITPDSLFTQLEDVSALSTYAYKAKYFNSVTGELSGESDWITGTGYSAFSLSKLRQRVKDNLFSAGFLKSDDSQIDDWINGWCEEMTNSAIKVNQSYSIGTTAITFGTAGLGTITESDFKQVRKFEVSYDTQSYLNSREIPINQFAEGDFNSEVYPCHYWMGDNVFGIRPAKSGGTARLTYYKLPARLDSDSDELPLSLRAYTFGCLDYCLMRAYLTDQKDDLAKTHTQLFMKSKGDFIAEMTPRDHTGIKTIQMDEVLSGRSDDCDFEFIG